MHAFACRGDETRGNSLFRQSLTDGEKLALAVTEPGALAPAQARDGGARQGWIALLRDQQSSQNRHISCAFHRTASIRASSFPPFAGLSSPCR